MGGEERQSGESLVALLKKHLQDIRDVVVLIASVLIAIAQTVATRNWGTAAAYAIAAAIVGAAVLAVVLWRRRGRARPVVAVPKGSAFRGLLPFEEDDREQFFGREIETGALFDLVTYGEFRFGVLTGESGCGKTSLLCAGLMPRLRESGYLPVYVRLRADPEEALKKALRAAAPEIRALPDDPKACLHVVGESARKPLVLVFDQFEEFFSRLQTRSERAQFLSFVGKSYSDETLAAKFLFCVREDALFRIAEFDDYVTEPLAARNRFHLRKLEEAQATDVIERLVRAANIPFESGLAARVCRDLAVEGAVLSTELQIVCQRMQSGRIFSLQAYREIGGKENLIQGYLEDVIRALGDEDAAKGILYCLIGEGNTKATLTAKEIGDRVKRDEARIRAMLSTLTQARLVRATNEQEPISYELVHEYLIERINALVGGTAEIARRADLVLRSWAARYVYDKKTRMPLGDWWLIVRHSGRPRGQKERELLARSFRWGAAKVACVVLLIAITGFAMNLLIGVSVTVNLTFPQEKLEEAARKIEDMTRKPEVDYEVTVGGKKAKAGAPASKTEGK